MNDKLILLFVFIGLLVVLSSFRRDRRKKIIFFGDSITQAGTATNGYISILNNILQKHDLLQYELTGAGIGGNKVYDLYERVEKDVIDKSPGIVVLYIGVNDVWHKRTHGTGTDIEKFEKFYRAIILKLQAADAKLILCTSAVIGEKKDNTNLQDDDLDKYAAVIINLGNDLQLPVCDLRMVFRTYLQQYNTNNEETGILTTDGVHLNELGNRLAAEAIWNTMETLVKR